MILIMVIANILLGINQKLDQLQKESIPRGQDLRISDCHLTTFFIFHIHHLDHLDQHQIPLNCL